jgi:hypothetical protein
MELVDTAGRFSTSPSLTTSSRPSNVTHASTTTERAARWTTPAATPDAIAAEIGRAVDYRPVETDGAPALPTSSPNFCKHPAWSRTSTARPCGSTADDSPGHESLRPLPDRRKPLPSLVALVAVTASTRSYAFSDRCALGDPQQQPGSEGMADKRFRRSTTVLWTWLDLNQRPHPYQVSRAKRCAGRRFPRSPVSVKGEGMRS